jgi:hypothetical protein
MAALIGLGEDEFWQSTPRYFASRQKAYRQSRQSAMEDARLNAWLSIQPHLGKDARVKLTDLCTFPWEQKEQIKWAPVDPEVFKRFHEKSERLILDKRKR